LIAASLPGIIDFLSSKDITPERRENLFAVLVNLQRKSSGYDALTNKVDFLIEGEDRGSVLYALCSADEETWNELSSCLREINAMSQHNIGFTFQRLLDTNSPSEFITRLKGYERQRKENIRKSHDELQMRSLDSLEDRVVRRVFRLSEQMKKWKSKTDGMSRQVAVRHIISKHDEREHRIMNRDETRYFGDADSEDNDLQILRSEEEEGKKKLWTESDEEDDIHSD